MRAVAWLKALTSCANARLSLSVIALILGAAPPHCHTQRTIIPAAALFLLQSLTLLKEMPSYAFAQPVSLLLHSLL